jgi:hypothetical protein
VGEVVGEDIYHALVEEVAAPFATADFPELIRIMDKRFNGSSYNVRSLFRDEQRKILSLILASTMAEAETLYRQIYEQHAPLMRLLTDLNIPSPRAFRAAAEVVLNANLREALEHADLDPERVNSLFIAARVEGVELDYATLEFALRRNLEDVAEKLLSAPLEPRLLRQLETASEVSEVLPFRVDLWKVQNAYYRVLQTVYPDVKNKAAHGDEGARSWADRFRALGLKLRVRVDG